MFDEQVSLLALQDLAQNNESRVLEPGTSRVPVLDAFQSRIENYLLNLESKVFESQEKDLFNLTMGQQPEA